MGLSYLFFPGCSFNTAAGYRQSTEAVCRAVDVQLNELPGWNCCGASAVLSLDLEEGVWLTARLMALAGRQENPEIVSGCNGCVSALKKGKKLLLSHLELWAGIRERLEKENLKLDRDDVERLRIRHLLEVFVNDVSPDSWKKGPGERNLKVASYYGCLFSRPDGDVDDPEHPVMLDKFIRILGLEPVEHSLGTACCGASHSLPHKGPSKTLVGRIIRGIQSAKADTAVVICPLCQFNLDSIQSELDLPPLPAVYFTQLAGLAMGLPASALGLDKLLTPFKEV
jgi:heterodisulfide reductase subunit B2